MYYLIKEKNSGLYLCSTRIKVIYECYARRFNSVKQANAYIHTSGLDQDDYSIEEREEEKE